LLSALAEAGGISSVIIISMSILVSAIVKARFYISLLNKVFLVDSPQIESSEISAKVKNDCQLRDSQVTDNDSTTNSFFGKFSISDKITSFFSILTHRVPFQYSLAEYVKAMLFRCTRMSKEH
jgi:hypothetical protein